MKTVVRSPRAEQWATRICVQMGKSVESILEVGRLLVKAKADLEHGEWGRLFDDELVPFGQRTATRLMAVSEHPVLSNRTHVSNLPPSWGTLYELTKADPTKLKNALKDGAITPDMPRKAVAALLPPRPKRAPDPAGEESRPTPIATWSREAEAERISRVLRPARDLARDWPDECGFDIFIHEVTQLLKLLQRLEERRRAALSA